MLARDALVYRSIKQSELGEPGVCKEDDGRTIHKRVLARLYDDRLVGVWALCRKVNDDGIAGLRI